MSEKVDFPTFEGLDICIESGGGRWYNLRRVDDRKRRESKLPIAIRTILKFDRRGERRYLG